MTQRPQSQAVVDAITAAGVVVGLGAKPTAAGTKWAVVYPMLATDASSLADPHGRSTLTVQINSFGTGPEQAEWVADKVRTALLALTQLAGRTITGCEHAPSGPLSRDDTVSPPIFWCGETFALTTT